MPEMLVGQKARLGITLHDRQGRVTDEFDRVEPFEWELPEGLVLEGDDDDDPRTQRLIAEAVNDQPGQVRVSIDGAIGPDVRRFTLASSADDPITIRDPRENEAVGGEITIQMLVEGVEDVGGGGGEQPVGEQPVGQEPVAEET